MSATALVSAPWAAAAATPTPLDAVNAAPTLTLGVSLSGVLAFVLIGLLVFGALQAARAFVRVSRWPRSRRVALETAVSALEVVAGFVYVLSAVPTVFSGRAEYSPYFAAVVAAAVLWVSWVAVRDLVHGVIFKAARVCRPGDVITLGGAQGRVARLGYRHLTLITARGDEVVLPYGVVSRETLVRAPVEAGAARHAFHLPRPGGVDLPRVTRAVQLAAFTHPWASAAHESEVALGPDETLEVGVYALDPLSGPAIEARVREAVAALSRR